MKFEMRRFSKRFPEFECAVFVIHEPYAKDMAHRGTAAAIILPDGRFWKAVALCSPSDPYVKATGRSKAVGRAFQAMRNGDSLGEHGWLSRPDAKNWDVPALKACLTVEIAAAKAKLAAMREYAGIHQ